MFILKHKIAAALLGGFLLLGVGVPQASAQWFRQRTLPVYSSGVNPRSPFYNPVNPLYRVAPGVSWQQAMYQNYAPLYAASRLPPWIYGYNPYPAPIIVTPPVYPTYYPPYVNPYVPYVGVGSYPYTGTFSVNPYTAY